MILFGDGGDGIEMTSDIMDQDIPVFILDTQHLIIFSRVVFSQEAELQFDKVLIPFLGITEKEPGEEVQYEEQDGAGSDHFGEES